MPNLSRELRDYSGRKFIFIGPWQLVAAARGAGIAGLQVFRVNICIHDPADKSALADRDTAVVR